MALRTPHVYAPSHGPHDRDEVVVAAQVSDAEGNTQVDQAGLALQLVLHSAAAGASSAGCAVAAVTGLATCRLAVPSGWFASAGTVDVVLQLSYGGVVQAELGAGSVSLHAAPAHAQLAASGMTLSLPTSPRFGGDQFVAEVSASLIGVAYGLMAWQATLSYDAQLLSLDAYAVDAIWGDAATVEEAGSLGVLMNEPADTDPSNAAVTGEGIPILSATFSVAEGATAGSHAGAVSLRVRSMLNFGNAFVAEEQDALVLDGRDGGAAAGEVVVEAAVVQGLFAFFDGGSASLLNTAPLTGANVSTGVSARTASTRPHAADFSAAAAACASPASDVLSLAGCLATASVQASEGGAASLQVTASGLTADLTLHIWHPAPLSLQLDDATLHRLAGCAAGGGDGAYQSSRLRVLSGGLDATPLLGSAAEAAALLSLPAAVALEPSGAPGGRAARLTVRGVAVGGGTISLVHSPTATVSVVVQTEAVTVDAFFVGALTVGDAGDDPHSQLALSPSTGLAPSEDLLSAQYGLDQRLQAEGDVAHLFGVAMLSDGATQAAPPLIPVRPGTTPPPTHPSAPPPSTRLIFRR